MKQEIEVALMLGHFYLDQLIWKKGAGWAVEVLETLVIKFCQEFPDYPERDWGPVFQEYNVCMYWELVRQWGQIKLAQDYDVDTRSENKAKT